MRQTTYVNGVASSEVRLQTAAVETQKGKAKDEAKKKTKPKNPWQKESEEPTEKEAKKEAEKEKKDDEKKKEPSKKETADEKKARELKERQARELYCLDPAKIALFHAPQSEPEAAGGVEDDERGLYVRYLKIVHFCWNADDVRKQMDALRAVDEELEVVHEAARSQADKFVLESMYHTATPIWFHPAFAAENADVRPAHEPRSRIPPRSHHPRAHHPPLLPGGRRSSKGRGSRAAPCPCRCRSSCSRSTRCSSPMASPPCYHSTSDQRSPRPRRCSATRPSWRPV